MDHTPAPPPVYFYPRPPRGGRLDGLEAVNQFILISIHALREEGDAILSESIRERDNFYPRPPRGGRLTPFPRQPRNNLFLSTPSARRATLVLRFWIHSVSISIHALREEGDLERVTLQLISAIFLSTPSARRATFYKARIAAAS